MPYLRTAFEGGDPDILIRKGVQNRENRKKTVFFSIMICVYAVCCV